MQLQIAYIVLLAFWFRDPYPASRAEAPLLLPPPNTSLLPFTNSVFVPWTPGTMCVACQYHTCIRTSVITCLFAQHNLRHLQLVPVDPAPWPRANDGITCGRHQGDPSRLKALLHYRYTSSLYMEHDIFEAAKASVSPLSI